MMQLVLDSVYVIGAAAWWRANRARDETLRLAIETARQREHIDRIARLVLRDDADDVAACA